MSVRRLNKLKFIVGCYLVCSDRSEFDTETWCEGKHPIYYVALILSEFI